MTQQIDRRVALTALSVGAAAVAVPSFAGAETTSADPISPLIEAYKAARKRRLKAYEPITVFEETHSDLLYRQPKLFLGIDNGQEVVATTHEEIDRQFDWYDRQLGRKQEKQRRVAHELFEAEVQEIQQLKDAAGITAAEAIEDRACEEQDAALEAVMRQKPTTLRGAATYAAVAADQSFTDHDRTAIDVLASALKALADAGPIV